MFSSYLSGILSRPGVWQKCFERFQGIFTSSLFVSYLCTNNKVYMTFFSYLQNYLIFYGYYFVPIIKPMTLARATKPILMVKYVNESYIKFWMDHCIIIFILFKSASLIDLMSKSNIHGSFVSSLPFFKRGSAAN